MEQKGISPLVATLILLAITVSLGAVVYRVVMSRATSVAGPDIMVTESSIVSTPSVTVVSVTVKNTGDVDLENVEVRVYGEGGGVVRIWLGSLAVGAQSSGENVNPPVSFRPGNSYAAILRAQSTRGPLEKTFTIQAQG
jgi:flagellin-like protein